MTLFNNCKLPLLEAQKLQQQVSRGVDRTPKDDKLDEYLALEYQRGNLEAGIELLKNYLDIVAYIYRYPTKTKNRGNCKYDIRGKSTMQDKEDLFQEICTHFFGLILEFDPTQCEFQGLIKGKLHLRVFRYYFSDFIDERMNEKEFEDGFDIEEALKEIFIDDNTDLPKNYRDLYTALSELTEPQRKVIEMTIVRGWTAKVIADELSIKEATVRKIKQRAIRSLKDFMEVA